MKKIDKLNHVLQIYIFLILAVDNLIIIFMVLGKRIAGKGRGES